MIKLVEEPTIDPLGDCSEKKKLNNSFLNFKEYRIFSRLFDIANQLRTRHSPLPPLDQADE